MESTARIERAERRIAQLEARLEGTTQDDGARIWLTTLAVLVLMMFLMLMSTRSELSQHRFDAAREVGDIRAEVMRLDSQAVMLTGRARR